jgi:uncharacterized repeat protein (TIGR01451 family)
MRRRLFALGFVVLGLVPGIAVAKPAVKLTLAGSLVGKSADGHVTLTPVERITLKPGDDVEYAITAVNGGDSAATHFVPSAKIPAGTTYVDGSAKAPRAHAEFSLDGGKTWAAQPTVTVKGPAGTPVVKKADPALYTAVRFVTDGALEPHQSLVSRYDVRVK